MVVSNIFVKGHDIGAFKRCDCMDAAYSVWPSNGQREMSVRWGEGGGVR